MFVVFDGSSPLLSPNVGSICSTSLSLLLLWLLCSDRKGKERMMKKRRRRIRSFSVQDSKKLNVV